MDARPAFQRLQYQFTGNIRDPDHRAPPADLDAKRMALYRRLVYNNLEGYLHRAFPVLRACYTDAAWHALVRDFFVRHQCRARQFYLAAEEFLRYLQDTRGVTDADPPFLLELAHYEWLELMLYVLDETADLHGIDRNGDLLAGVPVVSPLAYNLAYRYPVHAIDPKDPPAEAPAEATHLVVYRDLGAEEEVHFLKVNAVTAALLARLQQAGDASGREQLEAIAAELGHADAGAVVTAGEQILADLAARDIVLGVRAAL